MKHKNEFEVSGRVVSWVYDGPGEGPAEASTVVFLAHGAGASYDSEFMRHVAAEWGARGLGVVRFHFPYMEQMVREGKRRPPNSAKTLLETWRRMLEVGSEWGESWVLSGKSMGGRMASMLLAEGAPPKVVAAIYLGYPLHPAGKPERLRSEHLPRVQVPQLFISGTRDTLCDLSLLRPVLDHIGDRATLHAVEKGDHSLATQRKEPLRGSTEWLNAGHAFVCQHCRG